jgi:hypothetical protein
MNIRTSIAAVAVSFCLCAANVAMADVIVCPLEEALRRLEDYNRKLSAELAQKQMPVLAELQTLISKAKNPSLPTGAQLSKAEKYRFQQLREEMLTIQAKEIVSSAATSGIAGSSRARLRSRSM